MNILLSTADFKKRQSALTVHDVSPSSSDPYSRGRGKNEMCVLHPVWFFDIFLLVLWNLLRLTQSAAGESGRSGR